MVLVHEIAVTPIPTSVSETVLPVMASVAVVHEDAATFAASVSLLVPVICYS
jgi:hypothetical protein